MFFRKVPDFQIHENLELGDLPILDFMPDFLCSRKGEKCIKNEVPLRFHEFYEDIWKQNSVHEKKSQILCVIKVELLGLGIVSNPHFPEIFLIEENWAWNLNLVPKVPLIRHFRTKPVNLEIRNLCENVREFWFFVFSQKIWGQFPAAIRNIQLDDRPVKAHRLYYFLIRQVPAHIHRFILF